MTNEELLEHAQRIAEATLMNLDYSHVYEDGRLEDASDEDRLAVYQLVIDAQVVVSDEIE